MGKKRGILVFGRQDVNSIFATMPESTCPQHLDPCPVATLYSSESVLVYARIIGRPKIRIYPAPVSVCFEREKILSMDGKLIEHTSKFVHAYLRCL